MTTFTQWLDQVRSTVSFRTLFFAPRLGRNRTSRQPWRRDVARHFEPLEPRAMLHGSSTVAGCRPSTRPCSTS